MVCLPCFVIPVVLFFWRWLIQPFFLKYIWNPWEKKDKEGKVIEHGEINHLINLFSRINNCIKFLEPEFIKNCEGGVCTFMKKPKTTNESSDIGGKEATVDDSKKDN